MALRGRILVISHNESLRMSRAKIIENAGYIVESTRWTDRSLALVRDGGFDLILLGRESTDQTDVDQVLRENFPKLQILKIDNRAQKSDFFYSRVTDSHPRQVLSAISEMLGEADGFA